MQGAVLALEQWQEKGRKELSSSDIEQWPRAQRLLGLPDSLTGKVCPGRELSISVLSLGSVYSSCFKSFRNI